MALTQKLDLRPNLVSIWERKTVGNMERKRKIREDEGDQAKVWKLTLSMDFWSLV